MEIAAGCARRESSARREQSARLARPSASAIAVSVSAASAAPFWRGFSDLLSAELAASPKLRDRSWPFRAVSPPGLAAMLALLAAPALSPALHTAVWAPRPPARTAVLRAQSIFANDGDSEIDWDKEVLALTRPKNRYYQELKKLDAPQLIKEFADTAPKEVQMAVKVTISQLLGSLPPQIADGVLRARGRSLASLMFSMQMTGYVSRRKVELYSPSLSPNGMLTLLHLADV